MYHKLYTLPRKFFTCFSIIFVFMFFTKQVIAQPILSLTPVIDTGLTRPVQFANAGDSAYRVFIVQQGGDIRVYDSSFNFLSTFLTVSNVLFDGSERGLLSMAFHPDYKNNGFFFVYYVNANGSLELARYHVSSDPNLADGASKVIVYTIPHPRYANHNGGELHFGKDSLLYLSTGDGGGSGDASNNAQDTTRFLGKILRFNVNTSGTAPYFTIPAGNPYNNPIFHRGLRNPYRWSFDRQTGDMWIGDVGQDAFEEIDFRSADSTTPANFGWHCYEADATFNTTGCADASTYVFPIFSYPSQSPSAAVTGGIVYRGIRYPPMQGYYMSADVYSGNFYKTVADGSGGWTTTMQNLSPAGIVDFGETEGGEAYAVSLTSGSVYHITASGPLAVKLVAFNGTPGTLGANINWQTTQEENMSRFELEYSTNGASFTHLETVAAKNSATGSGYKFSHRIAYDGAIFYRLKIVNLDASFNYSGILRMVLHSKEQNIVTPSVIANGVMNINLLTPVYSYLELINMNGMVIIKKDIRGQSGQIKIPLNKPATGVYTVRLIGNSGTAAQKILIR